MPRLNMKRKPDSLRQMAVSTTHLLEIHSDDSPFSPRDDDNLGTMVCWHGRYNLGDKHDFSDPEAFYRSLAEDYVNTPEGQVVIDRFIRFNFDHLKLHKCNSGDGTYTIVVNEDGDGLRGDNPYVGNYFDSESEAIEFLEEEKEELRDNALDEMNMELLRDIFRPFVVMLPLNLYDHGGITMSTGSFSCSWDSGKVGWIYATKERFIKETGYDELTLFGTDKNKPLVLGDTVKLKGDKRWNQYKVTALTDTEATIDCSHKYSKEWVDSHPELMDSFIKTLPLDQVELVCNYAAEMLDGEVETYDQYLTGDIYGFIMYKMDEEGLKAYLEENEMELSDLEYEELHQFAEETDACWGFYGSDPKENGMKGHLAEEQDHLFDELEDAY